jgi:hypothetical protein
MKMILRTMMATLAMTTMFASSAMAAQGTGNSAYLVMNTSEGTSFQMNVLYTDSTSESIDCDLDIEADLLSCGDLPDLEVNTVVDQDSIWVGEVDMDDWQGEVADAEPTAGPGSNILAHGVLENLGEIVQGLKDFVFGKEEKTKEDCIAEFQSAMAGCDGHHDFECFDQAFAEAKDCMDNL